MGKYQITDIIVILKFWKMQKISIDNTKQEAENKRMNQEIDFLSTFMLPERFERIKSVVKKRTNYITVCMENLFYGQNSSAIIRSTEAFGIQNIHVIEDECQFSPNIAIVKGAHKWLDIHRHNEDDATLNLVKQLKSEGYRIVVTSPHIDGVSAENYDVNKGKIALFLGTENVGVSQILIDNADDFIRVDMFGFVESFNVSVCGAIILNSLTNSLHRSEIEWQLTDQEQLVMLNRWMKLSVKDSENIIKSCVKAV